MSQPIISITVTDAAIRDRLLRLQRKLGDLTPVMKNIGEQLLLSTDDRWNREVDPDGAPWRPNSRRTIAQKRAQGRILKILQSTGRARASISYKADRDSVAIGTNLPYMRKHQLGLEGQEIRKFLGVSNEDRQEILLILDEFLAE